MQTVNIHEAKTHLSRLVEEAAAGDEIVIAKAGKPIARLVPYEPEEPAERVPGIWRGKVKIAKDFDVLYGEVAAAFRGERP